MFINCSSTFLLLQSFFTIDMLVRIWTFLFRIFSLSFLLWIVLSTVVPQIVGKYTNQNLSDLNRPYSSITSPSPLPIHDSNVYFVIGHPDDEVMFFSPSLIELNKKKYNNNVKLICFSNGDAAHESMGKIRTEELYQSGRILGLEKENVIVLNKFKDGMDEKWDTDDIKKTLEEIVGKNQKGPLTLITFDESGVSKHPNHISLYYGTKKFFQTHYTKKNVNYKFYVLKTLNFWEKYSFNVLTNVELFVDHLSKLLISNILKIKVNISFFSNSTDCQSIKIYSDLNMLSVSYAAMSYGHFSQMVWFRYGWLILSRYLTFNHLTEINK